MVLGTSSGAGKSLMTAALCRVLQRRGEQALPFKGQNMSNNAWVDADGEAFRPWQPTERCSAVCSRAHACFRLAIAHPNDLLDRRSRDRACRAMGCLPFSEALYRDLQQQGLSLIHI